jgi:hypothetical protein
MNVIIGQIRWDSGANKDAGCVKKKEKNCKSKAEKSQSRRSFCSSSSFDLDFVSVFNLWA